MHRHFRTDVWDRWLEQVGLDLTKVRNIAEFDNMFAVARAAERGAGIALLPLLVCEPWFASGALAQIEGFELQVTRLITWWRGAKTWRGPRCRRSSSGP